MISDDPLVTYDHLAGFGIGYTRKGIWEKCRAGTFPMPIQLGANRIAWKRSTIQKWIDTRPQQKPPLTAVERARAAAGLPPRTKKPPIKRGFARTKRARKQAEATA
jgi:predicted DNA-binding transcriptional regulator AlpA